jgi:hypothetical protein
VVVERRDRLAMEGAVVGEIRIRGHCAPPGGLEIQPPVRVAAEGRHETPRAAGRCVPLADVGKLHGRRLGNGRTAGV